MAGSNKDSSIGTRIRQARERLGFNQAKLASEAEITPAAVSQIESGERTPSTPILKKIASVLRVSSDFLLGATDETELQDLLQDQNLQKFFRGYKDLGPKDQELIQQQIEFLKSQKKK